MSLCGSKRFLAFSILLLIASASNVYGDIKHPVTSAKRNGIKLSRSPADIDPELLKEFEEASSGDTKPILAKKIVRSRAVFSKGGTLLRFLRDQRRFGQVTFATYFPVAADFAMYMASSMRSGSDSRSEADMSTFNYLYYLYTPHFKNFGLVGMATDQSGTSNQAVRGGLYFKLSYSSKNVSIGLVPMAFPFREGDNLGRFTMLYGIEFYKRVGLMGHFSHNWMHTQNTISSAPGIYVLIAKNIRLMYIYDMNTGLTSQRYGSQVGAQFSF